MGGDIYPDTWSGRLRARAKCSKRSETAPRCEPKSVQWREPVASPGAASKPTRDRVGFGVGKRHPKFAAYPLQRGREQIPAFCLERHSSKNLRHICRVEQVDDRGALLVSAATVVCFAPVSALLLAQAGIGLDV